MTKCDQCCLLVKPKECESHLQMHVQNGETKNLQLCHIGKHFNLNESQLLRHVKRKNNKCHMEPPKTNAIKCKRRGCKDNTAHIYPANHPSKGCGKFWICASNQLKKKVWSWEVNGETQTKIFDKMYDEYMNKVFTAVNGLEEINDIEQDELGVADD